MKALEMRAMFRGTNYDHEKCFEMHKKKLREMESGLDTSEPPTLTARSGSPSKRQEMRKVKRDKVTKENLMLARKIFNIMEGHSSITSYINDTRHLDTHPGTMNFRHRLEEAQRIHQRNMMLAQRLDTVQPYYKAADLHVVKTIRKHSKKHGIKKTRFVRELETAFDQAGVDQNVMTTRSEGAQNYLPGLKFNSSAAANQGQNMKQSSGDNTYTRPKSHHVLLEYSKVQDGHVLDVAVIKEPFRDRYAIFGIDIDDGQRYELRLRSEDVSNILDGDILVTSVDNAEVWMALLNKVKLYKVDKYTKLPFTAEEVDHAEKIHSKMPSAAQSEKPLTSTTTPKAVTPRAPTADSTTDSNLAASRPTSQKPSSRGRVNRSRGAAKSDTADSGASNAARQDPLETPRSTAEESISRPVAAEAKRSAEVEKGAAAVKSQPKTEVPPLELSKVAAPSNKPQPAKAVRPSAVATSLTPTKPSAPPIVGSDKKAPRPSKASKPAAKTEAVKAVEPKAPIAAAIVSEPSSVQIESGADNSKLAGDGDVKEGVTRADSIKSLTDTVISNAVQDALLKVAAALTNTNNFKVEGVRATALDAVKQDLTGGAQAI